MTIQENYFRVHREIEKCARNAGRDPHSITLVCVSKGQSPQAIQTLYDLGVRDFGENRVGEALTKQKLLPSDIRWHFIGTLQSNKVNKVVGHFSLIHSVDSLSLAQKISETALQHSVEQSVLIQVNVSGESTKHGFTREFLVDHFLEIALLPQIRVQGLMTMAPRYIQHSPSEEENVRRVFAGLAQLQKEIQKKYPIEGALCTELSMGMSQDFTLAIYEGATLIRVGGAIFSSAGALPRTPAKGA